MWSERACATSAPVLAAEKLNDMTSELLQDCRLGPHRARLIYADTRTASSSVAESVAERRAKLRLYRSPTCPPLFGSPTCQPSVHLANGPGLLNLSNVTNPPQCHPRCCAKGQTMGRVSRSTWDQCRTSQWIKARAYSTSYSTRLATRSSVYPMHDNLLRSRPYQDL